MDKKATIHADSILVTDRQAILIAHLAREHSWDEWDLTELYAIHDLHSELHEQLPSDHTVTDVRGNLSEC